MQAGFAMLEIGFSRSKNAGTGVAKILTNLSIAAICYWAVGFAFAFGSADVLGISSSLIGSNGFFLQFSGNGARGLPGDGRLGRARRVEVPVPVRLLCGLPGDRLGLHARADQVRRLCDLRDRLRVDHLPDRLALGVRRRLAAERRDRLLPTGMQDFAGSTAVHLIGATGALAALLLLGPRKGKYGPDGKPRVIPGHSMPLVGLGIVILFFGWFGFNPGSTLGTRPTVASPRSRW